MSSIQPRGFDETKKKSLVVAEDRFICLIHLAAEVDGWMYCRVRGEKTTHIQWMPKGRASATFDTKQKKSSGYDASQALQESISLEKKRE